MKYKYILALVLFTCLLSISFGVIHFTRLSAELEEQVAKDGIGLADRLVEEFSDTNIPLLTTLENIKLFWEIMAREEVLYMQVVINGINYGPQPKIEESPPIESIHAGQESAKRSLSDGTALLDIRKALPRRIAISPGGIGVEGPSYVRVGLTLAHVTAEMRKELLTISLVSLGYIIAGVLVAFIFYKMILGPVETLMDSVKRFRHSRTVRAAVKSGDELETLAGEFNKMADTIEERDRRLEQMNKELREANKIKSEFLAMMGHELKTPLHSIRGFSQLLLEEIDGPITDKQRKDVDSILQSGDHLLELISNILRFSKIEAGEEKLHLEEVESAKLVTEAIQTFEIIAREKGIKIESEVNSLRLSADGTKLKQILINLISNAVKYTEEGRIKITAEEGKEAILFKVEDTGRGIEEEYRERIFEPFTQVDSSTTRESVGIGLGLAIVKKYVEMHGGKVWIESEPGVGSTFYFTVPQNSQQVES